MTNKTVISVSKPTPQWANYTFRVVLLFTTAATMIIAADPSIPDALKVKIGIYLKGFDFVVWGLSRMIGVDIKPEELQKQN